MGTTADDAGFAPGGRLSALDAVVATLLAAIVAWRVLVLVDHIEPVGIDMANWVRTYRSWWGSVDLDDVVVPPVAPLVAGLTNELVGLRWTSHLLMSVSSTAPAIGAWIVLRTRSSGVMGVVAVVSIALASSTSAAMAWGGLPQLLGLGVLMVFADRIDRFTKDPRRRTALVAGLWLALLAATSAMVLVAGSIVAVSMAVAAIVRHGRRIAALIAWIAVPSLPLIPLYAVMLSRLSIAPDAATGVGARAALDTVLDSSRWSWFVVIGVGAYGLVWQAARARGWSPCALPVALVAGAALPMTTGEIRFAYVLPTALVVAVAIVLEGMPFAPRLTALVALVALTIPAVFAQRQSVDYYAALVPDGVGTGIAWLSARSDLDQPVLVAPVNGAPFGWLVEAAGVDALVASRDDWLFFPEERGSADQAVRLLTGEQWPTEGDLARIQTFGIDWVFLPVAWGGQHAAAINAIEVRCPDRVPYRTDAVIVLRTADPCGPA